MTIQQRQQPGRIVHLDPKPNNHKSKPIGSNNNRSPSAAVTAAKRPLRCRHRLLQWCWTWPRAYSNAFCRFPVTPIALPTKKIFWPLATAQGVMLERGSGRNRQKGVAERDNAKNNTTIFRCVPCRSKCFLPFVGPFHVVCRSTGSTPCRGPSEGGSRRLGGVKVQGTQELRR